MKLHIRLVGDALLRSAVIALALAASTYAINGYAAEKKELTYVKTNLRPASKGVITVSPNRELTNETSMWDVKYSDPDFKTKEEWNYALSDTIDGSGKQTGYYVDTHEDGSKTFGDFVGTVKNTMHADGSWESTWEGTYKYLGGTGKFKNIKGTGSYKGRMSSKEPGKEEGRETIEY